jgi:hypothetical protein
MKLIPKLYPKLNVAISPIGDYFAMGMDKAFVVSRFVECNTINDCVFKSSRLIPKDDEKRNCSF